MSSVPLGLGPYLGVRIDWTRTARRQTLQKLAVIPLAGLLHGCGGGGDESTPASTAAPAPVPPMPLAPAPAPVVPEPIPPLPPSVTKATLLANLTKLQTQRKTLIGHQNTTGSGVSWRLADKPVGYSDFREACGKYPAVYGWELSYAPADDSMNWDGIRYADLIAQAKMAHNRGGLNMFCVHPHRLDKPYAAYNNGGAWDTSLGQSGQFPNYVTRMNPGGDLSAQYMVMLDRWASVLKQLKRDNGEPIPFVLRPFHEADAGWFWWGADNCSAQQYRTLFGFTVGYLRDNHGLTNLISCFAPCLFADEAGYQAQCPEDSLVDILGFDRYHENAMDTPPAVIKQQLTVVSRLAQQRGKVAAWAETGMKNLGDATYFNQLDQWINDSGAAPALLMFWANYSMDEFYVPHAASAAALKTAFMQFTQKPNRLVEGDFGDLYAAS